MPPDESTNARPRVSILGLRGVPAAHGGFETFAARLAPYLASTGWQARVYCQEDEPPPDHVGDERIWETTWRQVERVHIAVGDDTPMASIRFDWACISHVLNHRPDVVLMLGYNTAIFTLRLRLAGIPTVINMDGIEWRREKWSLPAKAWLLANEWAGCLLAQHLIADHPQIKRHLRKRVSARKITVVPYGTDSVGDLPTDGATLRTLGLEARTFVTVIARPEPENSLLEMICAFSAKPRGIKLVVLGNYRPDIVAYHARVQAAASNEVLFLGAIYDKDSVDALRRGSLLYMHGHRVGGCNPSLLEAMGAGNAVLANDNRFNRWVARDGAVYFSDQDGCERALERLLADPDELARLGATGRRRARMLFHWQGVLQSYSELLAEISVADKDEDTDWVWQLRAAWRTYSDAP